MITEFYMHSTMAYPIWYNFASHFCTRIDHWTQTPDPNADLIPNKLLVVENNKSTTFFQYDHQSVEAHPGYGKELRAPKMRYSFIDNGAANHPSSYVPYEDGVVKQQRLVCTKCNDWELEKYKQFNRHFNIIFNNCESIVYAPYQSIILTLLVAMLLISRWLCLLLLACYYIYYNYLSKYIYPSHILNMQSFTNTCIHLSNVQFYQR
jgi:hypothetical protein